MESFEETIEKLQNEKDTTIRWNEFELYHREYEKELQMKREQVRKLQDELLESHRKLHEMGIGMEKAKNDKKELEFNLNLAMKKLHNLENKLRDNNEVLMRTKVKQEMATSEYETLTKHAHELTRENYEYLRKINELETELKYYSTMQEKNAERYSKEQATTFDIKKNMEKLEEEQKKILGISSECNTRKLCESIVLLQKENAQLQIDKRELEENYIKISAKSQQFQELFQKTPLIQKPNLITNLILAKWKNCLDEHRETSLSYKNIMTNLIENLNKEKSANHQLVVENGKLENELVILKNQTQYKD